MAGHADPQVFPEHAAARILGVQVRRLRAWRDLVAPSITRQLSQRNTPAMYTFDEMLQLRVVVELTRRGIAITTVRRLVEHLRQHVSSPLAELVWATEGSAVSPSSPTVRGPAGPNATNWSSGRC